MSITIVTPVTPSITTQKVDLIAEYQALLEASTRCSPASTPWS
jgi:hypothetical protein